MPLTEWTRLTFAQVTSADHIQRFGEVEGEVRKRRHRGAGGGGHAAGAAIAREKFGGGTKLARLQAGPGRDIVFGQRLYGVAQRIHLPRRDPTRAEFLVLPSLRQDQPDQSAKDRRILSRIGLQRDVGELAGLASPRVNSDHLEAVRPRSL